MSYEMGKVENNTALVKKTAESVNMMLAKHRDAIMATMPKGFNVDRFNRTVINAISTNPMIGQCSPASLFLSTVRAASVGLEPNGATNDGYLVPFWNKQKSCFEAQFMPSYRGLISLARRSGEITDIYAREVCEKDDFEVNEGTERGIKHKVNYKEDRGDAYCYYAVYHLKDGSFDYEVMTKSEIEKVRAASKSGDKKGTPWDMWYEEMAKKTVIRRLLKRAPMSIEMANAVKLDNQLSATGEVSDDIIDVADYEIAPEEQTNANAQKQINAERTQEVKAKLEASKRKSESDEVYNYIRDEIKRVNAPVTANEVIQFAKDNNIEVRLDTNFSELVNHAASAINGVN